MEDIKKGKKPNIVFILSDDQGAWAMGCAGNREIITPNIDKLAKEGMLFSNFFCASPVCSPARASILTGTLPSKHGIMDWLSGGNLPLGISEMEGMYGYKNETKPISYTKELTAYTDLLAAEGYTCSLCGKWHMGDSMTPSHGFTKWLAMGRGGCEYYHGDVIKDGKLEFPKQYITDYLGEQALCQLKDLAKEEKPFYLSVHFTAPHSPWDEDNHPKEVLDLYKDCEFESVPNKPVHSSQVKTCPYGEGEERKKLLKGYYAAVTAMDRQIGNLMQELDNLGLREDTIVIFTSDNGMNMGHHGIWGKGNATYPQNMYDTSIKVPFLISWKGMIKEGGFCEELCSHYDILPTLKNLLGLSKEVLQPLPGRNLVPLLKEEKEDYAEEAIVILDEYGPVRMIRTKEWKLVERMDGMENELYHLSEDADEEKNLYGKSACLAVQEDLSRQLKEWYKKYGCRRIEKMRGACTGSGQFGGIEEFEEGKNCFGNIPEKAIKTKEE